MQKEIRPRHFWIMWFVAGLVVLPLSAALTIPIWLAMLSLVASTFDMLPYGGWHRYLFLAIAWLIIGFCIGFLQKVVVKRYLHLELPRWRVISVLAALFAGILACQLVEDGFISSELYSLGIDQETRYHIDLSIIIVTYLGLFSLFQYLFLRRHGYGTWRWVAAHAGSQIIAAAVLLAVHGILGQVYPNTFLSLAVHAPVTAAITGYVMLRLLQGHMRAGKTKHDDWVGNPPHSKSDPPKEPSVWDDAI